jgi:hypothetical protein
MMDSARPPLTMLMTSALVSGFCCANDTKGAQSKSTHPIVEANLFRTVSSPLIPSSSNQPVANKLELPPSVDSMALNQESWLTS